MTNESLHCRSMTIYNELKTIYLVDYGENVHGSSGTKNRETLADRMVTLATKLPSH